MKKIYLSILAGMIAAGVNALTVSPAQKIQVDGPAHNPVLNHDGTTLLFSSDNHTGLKSMNLIDNQVTVLAEATGAGFNPVFVESGKKVIYQTADVIDGLMNRDVRSFDFTTRATEQLAPMSRNDLNLNELAGVSNYVYSDYDKIVISNQGITKSVNPLENAHSYLWASLSPDGRHIAFVEPFQGVFIAESDGTNPVKVASKGDFPAWAGDNLLTFTVSHDDGYVILDSTLKIYDMTTGITVDLTGDVIKVGESTASANGKVVYSTLNGELFQISVKQ